MPVAVDDFSSETNEGGFEEVTKDGKVYERSQQDGELYSKPTIGIIYPPPEVRNIVDRTANFVARNGPEFEDRIRANEADNAKFNFLNPNDPYHAYYAHKLKEFRESDLSEPAPALLLEKEAPVKQQLKQKQVTSVIETIIPKDPPPAYEYMTDPPTISAIDLDVVKLTAQFVAKNGKSFLTNLMTREQRNYQFDFLRPQHSLFQYFTRLVEQYTKILLPPGDISGKLLKTVDDPWSILENVKYRVEWQRYQEREKRKVEDEKERARVAFAQIDWHDFVVVETVNFREDETANLPPPVAKEQLGARLLAQERMEKLQKNGEVNAEEIEMDVEDEDEEGDGKRGRREKKGSDDEQDDDDLYQPQDEDEKTHEAGSDMEEESDDEGEGVRKSDVKPLPKPLPPPVPPPAIPPIPGTNATIRKNYDPKAAKPGTSSVSTVSDKYLISPLTGEKVHVDSMDRHMKISLLDPRWKEQKEKAIEEKRQQEQVFAEGVHIGDTLKQLAERRSDIFGIGAEETFIGQKLGEDDDAKKPTKEIWDGHTSSMERATKLAHSNITFEDQIKAIHKAKGLIPSEEAQKIGPSAPAPAPLTIEEILGTSITPMQEPSHSRSGKHKQSSAPPPPLMPPKPMEQPSSKILPPPTPPTPPSIPAPLPLSRGAPLPPMSAPSSSKSNNDMPSNSSFSNAPIPPTMPSLPPPPSAPLPPSAPMPPLPSGPMSMAPRPPSMPMVRPPPLMPPPGMMIPPNMPPRPNAPFMPMPPVMDEPILLPPAPMEDEEPVSKKAKMDSLEAELIDENDFMKSNTKPVTFRVSVPELPDKPEWQCQGQTLSITLPLTDQCSVIKAKIYQMIHMPAGKQKLQLGNFFIKDSNSLAFYNFSATSIVQLQVKERGGRKK